MSDLAAMLLFKMHKPIRSFVVGQLVQLLGQMQMINFVISCALSLYWLRLALHEQTSIGFGCVVHSGFDFA
jgi:hypothetical protein